MFQAIGSNPLTDADSWVESGEGDWASGGDGGAGIAMRQRKVVDTISLSVLQAPVDLH